MDRYTVYASSTLYNVGKAPVNIPLKKGYVFDIHKAIFRQDMTVSGSGLLVSQAGLSYKTLHKEMFVVGVIGSGFEIFDRSDLICGYRISKNFTPIGNVADEREYDFSQKPYTVWCKPSLVLSYKSGGGTADSMGVSVEILGSVRVASEKEIRRLMISQPQEKRTRPA